MKILHIDTGRELRGGQFQVLLLIAGLRERGYECRLLAREGSPLYGRAREQGYDVSAATLAAVWRDSKLFDLVHAHDANSHTLCALASRRLFVVSRRVAFPVKRSPASHWKYARARRYLAVSRFVARELVLAGIRPETIDVVYDGVEEVAHTAQWEASFPAVALATSDPEKGRKIVERAAQLAGIPVVFSSDLARDFLEASMFVYITRSEGLGSAALSAMAMGVPVIASHLGGLTEVFEDCISGLFVRNEPNEIARAMRKIRENPALAATLIREGKRRVQGMFSKQHMINNTINSYKRALAG